MSLDIIGHLTSYHIINWTLWRLLDIGYHRQALKSDILDNGEISNENFKVRI